MEVGTRTTFWLKYFGLMASSIDELLSSCINIVGKPCVLY